eukprot:scaffold391_cov223-Pinguiococcus_pyrenoidosus.AAC.14
MSRRRDQNWVTLLWALSRTLSLPSVRVLPEKLSLVARQLLVRHGELQGLLHEATTSRLVLEAQVRKTLQMRQTRLEGRAVQQGRRAPHHRQQQAHDERVRPGWQRRRRLLLLAVRKHGALHPIADEAVPDHRNGRGRHDPPVRKQRLDAAGGKEQRVHRVRLQPFPAEANGTEEADQKKNRHPSSSAATLAATDEAQPFCDPAALPSGTEVQLPRAAVQLEADAPQALELRQVQPLQPVLVHERREHPEGFSLAQARRREQVRRHVAHALAVSDHGAVQRVGAQHAAHRHRQRRLGRHRPRQIGFDLLPAGAEGIQNPHLLVLAVAARRHARRRVHLLPAVYGSLLRLLQIAIVQVRALRRADREVRDRGEPIVAVAIQDPDLRRRAQRQLLLPTPRAKQGLPAGREVPQATHAAAHLRTAQLRHPPRRPILRKRPVERRPELAGERWRLLVRLEVVFQSAAPAPKIDGTRLNVRERPPFSCFALSTGANSRDSFFSEDGRPDIKLPMDCDSDMRRGGLLAPPSGGNPSPSLWPFVSDSRKPSAGLCMAEAGRVSSTSDDKADDSRLVSTLMDLLQMGGGIRGLSVHIPYRMGRICCIRPRSYRANAAWEMLSPKPASSSTRGLGNSATENAYDWRLASEEIRLRSKPSW